MNEFLNLKEDEMLGKSDGELFPEEQAKSYKQRDLEVLEKNIEIRVENWDKNAKGEDVFMETLKTAYLDSDGKVVGIVGISRDITHKQKIEQELKLAKEKAERADRLKSAFLANFTRFPEWPVSPVYTIVLP